MSAPPAFLAPVRTEQLCRVVVGEARATLHDVDASVKHSRPRRRAIVMGLVAAVLVCVVLGVNALTGGYGPARVDSAVAISSKDGWTTVTLTKSEVAPGAVVDALRAGGIAARLEWRAWPPESGPAPTKPTIVTWSMSTANPGPKGIGMSVDEVNGKRRLRFRSAARFELVLWAYRPPPEHRALR